MKLTIRVPKLQSATIADLIRIFSRVEGMNKREHNLMMSGSIACGCVHMSTGAHGSERAKRRAHEIIAL